MLGVSGKDPRDIAATATGAILLGMSVFVLSLPASPVRQAVEQWRLGHQRLQYVRENWSDISREADLLGGQSGSEPAVIEFVDYQCGYCRRFNDELIIADSIGNGLAIGVLQTPRPGDVRSHQAAKVAVCGAEQGVFNQVHHALFEALGSPTPPGWGSLGASAGVPDTNAFLECIESTATAARVARDSTIAETLKIRGTPTFAVRGRGLHTGAIAVESLVVWSVTRD